MKRIIALLLVLVMAISVIACDDKKTPSTSSTPSSGDNNPPAEQEDANIVFAENGKSKLYILVPEELTSGVNQARMLFQNTIKEKIGVTLMSGTMSDKDFELRIGNTDEVAAEMIAGLKEGEYAIKTVENKLYIVAYNDLYLYDVVESFLAKYLEDESCFEIEGKSMTLKKAINTVGETDKTTLRYYLASASDKKELDATVEAYATAKNEYYAGISSTVPYRRQGGCFDGTNIYQALISAKEECARIMKKNIKTGEMSYSEIRTDMGHANSMCYNSKTNEVIVVNGKTLLIFDADTLEYKTKKTISSSASAGLSYDPIGNRFIVGYFNYYKGDLSAATGKSFSHVKEIADKISNKTYNALQGTSTDGYLVLSLLADSNGGPKKGYSCDIAVYDTEGNYLGLIKAVVPNDDEPENVNFINGQIYVTVCTPQPVLTLYKVVIDHD